MSNEQDFIYISLYKKNFFYFYFVKVKTIIFVPTIYYVISDHPN